MLKEERFDRLLSILAENEFVTVKTLSEKLNVSMPTIRRDLAELADQNRLQRSHGGAMRLDEKRSTTPVDFRRSVNAKEKAIIARAAVRFLRSNSVVFIDASTTAAHIIDYLEGFRDLIVITNSLMSAAHLQSQGIRTYCLGGEVISSSIAVGGRIATEAASNFNIDLMFFSSYGVNDQGMIVDTSEKENELRRYILQHADTSVFLCDKSKFGKSSVFNFASLNEVDYMITNGDVPEHYPTARKEIILAR